MKFIKYLPVLFLLSFVFSSNVFGGIFEVENQTDFLLNMKMKFTRVGADKEGKTKDNISSGDKRTYEDVLIVNKIKVMMGDKTWKKRHIKVGQNEIKKVICKNKNGHLKCKIRSCKITRNNFQK